MSSTSPVKGAHLDVPSPASPARPRPRQAPSQRFPSTLFDSTPSRNVSKTDLLSPQYDDADPQRLPRPQAAPSLAHLPSISQAQRPSQPSRQSLQPFPASRRANRDNEFQADALWAEMQRTLADVELSALNTGSSSHVFGAAHSKALEDLRAAQIALAKAWAQSEADEIENSRDSRAEGDAPGMSARSSFEDATVGKAEALTSSPSKLKAGSKSHDSTGAAHRRRTSSSASAHAMAADLEAETERDIQLARKRRLANDKYFQQVNQGVLDVVARLDDVAYAMKQVESETREIWDERSLASTNTNRTADVSPDQGTEPRA